MEARHQTVAVIPRLLVNLNAISIQAVRLRAVSVPQQGLAGTSPTRNFVKMRPGVSASGMGSARTLASVQTIQTLMAAQMQVVLIVLGHAVARTMNVQLIFTQIVAEMKAASGLEAVALFHTSGMRANSFFKPFQESQNLIP